MYIHNINYYYHYNDNHYYNDYNHDNNYDNYDDYNNYTNETNYNNYDNYTLLDFVIICYCIILDYTVCYHIITQHIDHKTNYRKHKASPSVASETEGSRSWSEVSFEEMEEW